MLVDYTKVGHVYIVCGKTDLRRGIDGLAGIIQNQYQLDVYEDALFLFCGKRAGRLKYCIDAIEKKLDRLHSYIFACCLLRQESIKHYQSTRLLQERYNFCEPQKLFTRRHFKL